MFPIDLARETHRAALRGVVYALAVLTLAFIAFGLLSACTVLDRGADRAATRAAQALTFYCENSDQRARDEFRALLSEKAAPYSLTADCGDAR